MKRLEKTINYALNYMNNEKVISEGNSNNYWMP